MNTPSLLFNPLGAALRTHGTQRTLVSAIQRTTHKQLMDAHVDNPIQRAILISQTAKKTQVPTSSSPTAKPTKQTTDASKSHWPDDSCLRTQRRRSQPTSHPRAPTSHGCTSASLHSMQEWSGVDQRHSALARCLADLVTTHTGATVYIEQTIPGLPREPHPGAQPERARMNIVFNLHGLTYCTDTAVVTPFSSNAGLISADSARMAKREEKKKFDRYPRINLVPFVLEATGRPGYHAQKFIKYFFSDTDHPPTAIRDAWAAIQTTLHSCISKQQLRAVTT